MKPGIEYADKCSMFYWYPKIKDLEIAQPNTEMYAFNEHELELLQEDKISKTIFENIKPLAEKIGFPLFMRTDFSSCKHGWKKTCYVPSLSDLNEHIFELLTSSMMQGFLSYSDNGLALREFIPLRTRFTAFHGDFPVNKERRYFINNGKVQCHHPYWYPDAIKGHTDKKGWEAIVESLNYETEYEIEVLTGYAELVGTIFDGYWSVDFAKGMEGESPWYLIDMAEGDKSFHWLECEYCPEKMRKRYKKGD